MKRGPIPLSPKSDQHQISPCNINALWNRVVMRINLSRITVPWANIKKWVWGSGRQFHTNHCILPTGALSWCLHLQEYEKGLLRTSHKINLLDILSTSPHYFCKKWIGATNENSNFDPRVYIIIIEQRKCPYSHHGRSCEKRELTLTIKKSKLWMLNFTGTIHFIAYITDKT